MLQACNSTEQLGVPFSHTHGVCSGVATNSGALGKYIIPVALRYGH